MTTSTVGGAGRDHRERAGGLSAASFRTAQENCVLATGSDVFALPPATGVLASIAARRLRGVDLA